MSNKNALSQQEIDYIAENLIDKIDLKENKSKATQKEILVEIKKHICKENNNRYGDLESKFDAIADLWSVYLDKEIFAKDVAVMMMLLKIASIKTGSQELDNYVDIVGYATCAAEIESRLLQ